MAKSLPDVPYQACQFHCLSAAGDLTFEADRSMKKHLKAAFRQRLARLERRIERWSETDVHGSILADYADAIRSTLLIGGVAPFDLP